ncbi:hypothetical protein COO60DRAFT_575287 [Scenedesmus sp. NREL 46B-D3]|nr:hypothetical protein COO60DRAFT_575287 [Scenedesmus sp. NREL 46B-D3]
MCSRHLFWASCICMTAAGHTPPGQLHVYMTAAGYTSVQAACTMQPQHMNATPPRPQARCRPHPPPPPTPHHEARYRQTPCRARCSRARRAQAYFVEMTVTFDSSQGCERCGRNRGLVHVHHTTPHNTTCKAATLRCCSAAAADGRQHSGR